MRVEVAVFTYIYSSGDKFCIEYRGVADAAGRKAKFHLWGIPRISLYAVACTLLHRTLYLALRCIFDSMDTLFF